MHVFLSMYVHHLSGKSCKSQMKFACSKNFIKKTTHSQTSFLVALGLFAECKPEVYSPTSCVVI